ncbi:polyamine oxidase (propane-1-3-diamine-forming) [Apiospora aurea]|uniref:Polyamine oxidase (Propane-1-3-diamine-forming) n=1 Tax=Apiospora aurea TaxID=335848 RepID=A0ABR1QWB9_9PEZI
MEREGSARSAQVEYIKGAEATHVNCSRFHTTTLHLRQTVTQEARQHVSLLFKLGSVVALLNLIAPQSLFVTLPGASATVIPAEQHPHRHSGTCQKTKVAILGAGITSITIAQTLANASVTDFILVEYKDEIGGRLHHENFGKGPDGKPLLVECGANWAQGLGKPEPKRPLTELLQKKKWNIRNTPSNVSAILTYNETGKVDFTSEIEEYEEAVERMVAVAGELLADNIQDRTMREGLTHAGWKPNQRKYPQAADAVEWWLYDGEQAYIPEETSLVFNAAVSNFTFLQFSDENNFIVDQRGHNTWLKGEASEFLAANDPRLHLSTIVDRIGYSGEGVVVVNKDGSCIEADYAVTTFSLDVLQQEDVVSFEPALPEWKQVAIESFLLGTYTKIFLQFDETWWPTDTEFFLYADPVQRGWYPIWQSLDKEGFFPGSHAIFVTVTERESQRVERMTDAETQAEVMAVLRAMFPDVDVPGPTAFQYPRWGTTPWAYGSFSFSCWPGGTTLEQHQNLRANMDRLWFAGEHTSASYFGYMQGAWYEGRDVGNRLARLVNGQCDGAARGDGVCGEMVRYEVLHGTTEEDEYNIQNGWDGSSFQAS